MIKTEGLGPFSSLSPVHERTRQGLVGREHRSYKLPLPKDLKEGNLKRRGGNPPKQRKEKKKTKKKPEKISYRA